MTNPTETASPVDRLVRSVALCQADDPFALVTVVVPSPFVRVQLRRTLAARRGICNVGFRTWVELTTELGRSAAGPAGRVPSPRVVNEALRQVLIATPSPFDSFARSPLARAELASVLHELWRAGPSLRSQLVEHGGRAQALVTALEGVEAHLAAHGFVDPGRLLELAATNPVEPGRVGAVILWYPRPARQRDRAVLDHLIGAGVPVTTITTEEIGDVAIDRVIECRDPDEEARVIVRRLIAATDDGVPLWRQAIVHPPTDRYRRIVHQQLADAGVSSSGRSPMTLAQSTTGRALTGLLGLAEGAWARADVMRWLESAPITDGPEHGRVPVTRWDTVSAEAGVIEGLEQWRTRLARFADAPERRDGPREDARRAARNLAAFVERLATELEPRFTRWSQWAAWAGGVLDLYLPSDGTDAGPAWPSVEVVAARLVRELLAELGALDQVAAAVDLASFRHAVEDELASRPVRDDSGVARPGSDDDPNTDVLAEVGLPGPVGSGVFVGSPTEARGGDFARVYLVGMADQFLPGVGHQSSLVPEAELGEDWPSNERAAAELLDDLRAVLALADDQTVVSWPRIDPRTGREHGRSRWLGGASGLGTASGPETVPSWAAARPRAAAAAVPLSPADRLLGDVARATMAGRPLELHPAIAGSPPPMTDSVAAARSPIGPGFTRFEGRVGPGLARGIADELSPTRLESYATCPRRYLLERELRLKERFLPEATDQMEPRDRGTMVHDILATYVGERINDGAPASLDRLLEIAEVRFGAAADEGRCGPPLMARVERATLIRELRRFFEEDTLEPVAVELGFGRLGASDDVAEDRLEPSADVAALGRSVGAVELELAGGRTARFGGSVDRIDLGPGQSLVVSDYKTGRESAASALKRDPVAGGTKLQLALYALAARAYRTLDGPVHARYWFTGWNREDETLSCAVDEEVIDRLRDVVSTIVDGIDAGAFPAVPGDVTYRPGRVSFDNCVYCDFDRLCPTDRDRRWSMVQAEPAVAPVVELRQPPSEDLAGVVRSLRADLTESQ